MLVCRMRNVRMTLSSVFPSKAPTEFITKRVMAFLRECGCHMTDITLKSDQEPAIIAQLEDIAKARGRKGPMQTVIEHSPSYASKSNGVVERAVRSVEEHIRVMRSALEEKYKMKLGLNHPIWTWLTEYASFLFNRCEVGRDGQTAYERCKNKSTGQRGGIWRRLFVEEESPRWKQSKVGMLVGRRHVPRSQSH